MVFEAASQFLLTEIKMTIFKKQPTKNYVIYSAIILVGIFLDQLTKWLAVKYMDMYQSIPLIKNFLHITYTTNDGAAFGMLDSARWVFMVISILAIIGFIAYLYLGHAENMLYGVSVAMVISGGIGNMIDRISLHYVVDFIDFRLINFAVFNGADSFVCVGAGLLVLALILEMKEEMKKEKAKKAAKSEVSE